MVKLFRARKEKRARDRKRRRWILRIGQYRYHITEAEVDGIYMVIQRAKGRRK